MKATLVLFLLLPMTALAERPVAYCLGQIHLAGHPPHHPILPGESLQMESVDAPLLTASGQPVGHVPSVYREAVSRMRSRGVVLRFEVRFQYPDPAPGRFLLVEVWAETGNPDDLVPLIYGIAQTETPVPPGWE